MRPRPTLGSVESCYVPLVLWAQDAEKQLKRCYKALEALDELTDEGGIRLSDDLAELLEEIYDAKN